MFYGNESSGCWHLGPRVESGDPYLLPHVTEASAPNVVEHKRLNLWFTSVMKNLEEHVTTKHDSKSVLEVVHIDYIWSFGCNKDFSCEQLT